MSIKLMVPGETSVVQSTSKFAYLDTTAMPPSAALEREDLMGEDVEWEVTLVSFVKPKQLPELEEVGELTAEATRRKEQANQLFKEGKISHAQAKYELLAKELKSVLDMHMHAQDDDPELDAANSLLDDLQVSCMLNLAACAQKQSLYSDALRHCNKVLQMRPSHPKALYRRGQTLTSISEWDPARADFRKMAELDPSTQQDADLMLAKVNRLEKAAVASERGQFKGFLERE